MNTTSRNFYSKEYKINAVRMVTKEVRRASEVARDLGINSNLIFQWKRIYLDTKKASQAMATYLLMLSMYAN